MKEANEGIYEYGVKSTECVDFDKEGMTVIDGLIYAETEDGVLRMDVIYDGQAGEKKPAIVWVHGGAWFLPGVTRKSRPEKRFLELAKKGYLLASIDYRYAQIRPFPCQLEDCKCAVRFLRANAEMLGIDPERIGFWGESCGGQAAGLMSITEGQQPYEDKGGYAGVSSEIKAAVAWYGALDYKAFHEDRKAESPDYMDAYEVIYGGTEGETKEVFEWTNPINHIEKKHCPILSMSSDADPSIPYQANIEFCERAGDYGNIAKNIVIHGQGHGYLTGEDVDKAVYEFFDEYLKA